MGLPSCLAKREHGGVALSLKRWLRSGSHNFYSRAVGLNLVVWSFLAARESGKYSLYWWPCDLPKHMVFFHGRGN